MNHSFGKQQCYIYGMIMGRDLRTEVESPGAFPVLKSRKGEKAEPTGG